MKYFALIIPAFLISCGNNKPAEKTENVTTNTEVQKPKVEEPVIVDSGQVWFSVNISKNDSPFMNFEGSWPMLLRANDFATLQLSKSEKLMSVTDMLTLYIYGLAPGKKTVKTNAGKSGEASMIISPVKDGVYGLPVIPDKGFVNISKNDSTTMTGNYEAEVTDANKDVYKFKGVFLNVKFQ